jgi:cytidine deaminase
VGTIDLRGLARQAAQRAHAPYSHFRVGAAVVDGAGSTFQGCNVESASYGLSMCAERVAIFAAIGAGARLPLAGLAVVCLDARPGGCVPCGACRQIMLELLAPEAAVYLDSGEVVRPAELLPRGFQLPCQWPS